MTMQYIGNKGTDSSGPSVAKYNQTQMEETLWINLQAEIYLGGGERRGLSLVCLETRGHDFIT